MELLLSKFLPVFVLPLGAAISLSLLAGLLSVLRWKRVSLLCFTFGIGYLLASSLPVVADSLCSSLEKRFQPVTIRNAPKRDAVVVLGGALGQPLPPRTESDLGDAADRVLTAARLYRAGKAEKIIVAAGNLPWTNTVKPEAVLIKELLVEWGVPDHAIILDAGSRNSYENAINTKSLLEYYGLNSVLLVTSAAHMPRAFAVFAQAGVKAFPVPTDYQVVVSRRSTVLDWLPSADALALTTMVLREWMGMWVYRMRGWVYQDNQLDLYKFFVQ